MVILISLLVLAALFFIPPVRLSLFHLIHFLIYVVVDPVRYIKMRKWNTPPAGTITCYTGLFGKGKTLSMVHYARKLFRRYQGKKSWSKSEHKLLPNKFIFLTNIDLYFCDESDQVEFTSMQQFCDLCVQITENRHPLQHDYNLVVIAIIDEISSVCNSREFKSNFNNAVLSTLLQIRKFSCLFLCTSQKFGMMDKLLRDVTLEVIDCSKSWRYQKNSIYDGWDLENGDPSKLEPLRNKWVFITDTDYNSYSTLRVAKQISKAAALGDLVPESETVAASSGSGNTFVAPVINVKKLKVK